MSDFDVHEPKIDGTLLYGMANRNLKDIRWIKTNEYNTKVESVQLGSLDSLKKFVWWWRFQRLNGM